MKGLFKVKFVSERKNGHRGQPGAAGNWDRQPWQLVVERLAKDGIRKVESVRHDDENPTNKEQLNHKELLALWKAVEQQKSK
jgi:hypothetical protein